VRILLLLSILCLPGLSLIAQKKNESYQLPLHRTSAPVRIDGEVDEPAWQEAAVATDFFMVLPMDTSAPRSARRCA
jgi:hypothetical protein